MKTIRVIFVALLGMATFLECTPSKKMSKQSEPYVSLRAELRSAAVLMAGDTIKVIYPELAMFDFGKDVVKAETRPSFVRFANILKEYPNIRIIINGYTDNVGPDDVNLDLSNRRAAAAHEILLSNGVADSRMITVGRGPDRPMMDNSTEYGRSKNRRVEFLLYRVGK